jgi:hypothetical protein
LPLAASTCCIGCAPLPLPDPAAFPGTAVGVPRWRYAQNHHRDTQIPLVGYPLFDLTHFPVTVTGNATLLEKSLRFLGLYLRVLPVLRLVAYMNRMKVHEGLDFPRKPMIRRQK